MTLPVALLLSASSINQEEADKLVEQMTAEVKADDTAMPKNVNNVHKTLNSKSTASTSSKKTSNPKDSSSKSATIPKVNGRTVTKKTATSSGLPSVRPSVPGRSPVAARRNAQNVSDLNLFEKGKGIFIHFLTHLNFKRNLVS